MVDLQSLLERYKVAGGKPCELSDYATDGIEGFLDKAAAKEQLAQDTEAIDVLQNRLFAESRQALLVIFQGMDCSGKDGTTRAVFSGCSPIGLELTSFKVPSEIERAHDYLWRVHKACPAKGYIGIFNRSHYEDVLVVKVENFAPHNVVVRRYEEINQFEKLLSGSGTRILKFMLHLSPEEQAKRLQERIDDPHKHWKFNSGDLATRAKWPAYMEAYETALSRCSTEYAPWFVIPADRNWVRNGLIAAIIRATLEEMNPQYPQAEDWEPAKIKII